MKLSKDSLLGAVKNNRNILVNILGAFLVKGGSMLLTLFLLPAYLKFFGNDDILGIWYTILSIINWVLVFDLGIGNGLRNKLPKALADKNARVILDNAKLSKMSKINEDFNNIGSYLKEKLKLNNFPYRMECYDISHIQGTNTVASMVTFINGLPKKSAYRKFKIKSTEGKPDDFLSMKQVLTRRLSRLGEKGWEKPDLVIIDGGKGQLSSVMQIVEEMGVSGIDFVSLAKRQEEVFLPRKSKSIMLTRESSELFLIQRIRDEAHRFAITYHRNLRSKNALTKTKKN